MIWSAELFSCFIAGYQSTTVMSSRAADFYGEGRAQDHNKMQQRAEDIRGRVAARTGWAKLGRAREWTRTPPGAESPRFCLLRHGSKPCP